MDQLISLCAFTAIVVLVIVGMIVLWRTDPKEMNVEFEDKLLAMFAAGALGDPDYGPRNCFVLANEMVDEYCKWTGLKRAVRKNK